MFTYLNVLNKMFTPYMWQRDSQNKTKQIKCNDINKNIILPPNNVVPRKQLWMQQSGCQATQRSEQRCMCVD